MDPNFKYPKVNLQDFFSVARFHWHHDILWIQHYLVRKFDFLVFWNQKVEFSVNDPSHACEKRTNINLKIKNNKFSRRNFEMIFQLRTR